MPLDIKETKLGKSDQEAPLSACKNAGVVLMPCCRLKCVPTGISGVEDISKVPGCHLFEKYFKAWRLMNSQCTFLILAYF